MSGALFFYFWDDTTWGGGTPPPSPAPSPTPDPGAGGGKRKKKADYIRADENFWSIREAYLRSINVETLPELPPAPRPTTLPPAPPPQSSAFNFRALPRYTAERASAISALRAAETVESLKAAGARLLQLNRAIQQARLEEAAYRRAIRKYNRQKTLKRAKRKLAILLASELLLKLITSKRP